MLIRLRKAIILAFLLLSGLNWAATPVFSLDDTRLNPSVLSYTTKYIWWLVSWESNSIICTITVYHPGFPSVEETRKSCGNTYTQQWQSTAACNFDKGCKGYYMHLASSGTVLSPFSPEDPLLSSNQLVPQQNTPNPVDACAAIWQTQPLAETPYWLTTPERSEDLATNDDLYYLAGRLIAHKIVDASACASGGVKASLYADQCGMEIAKPVVQFWQNQFDPLIHQAARTAGIPAVLLKRLFVQESQLWPGTDQSPYHFGLGQATELGVDVLFIYDKEFYKSFCPLMLSPKGCEINYYRQSPENKAILRGALTFRLNADCPTCPTGIDLAIAKESIPIFADLLVANCRQVAQNVINTTGYSPGAVSNYEDLWRFTLSNYHVGSGCVSFAMYRAWERTRSLDGEEVAARFTQPCASVIPYVRNITR